MPLLAARNGSRKPGLTRDPDFPILLAQLLVLSCSLSYTATPEHNVPSNGDDILSVLDANAPAWRQYVHPAWDLSGRMLSLSPLNLDPNLFEGSLQIDVPQTVQEQKDFSFDLWSLPTRPDPYESIQVFMEQTDRIEYEPRVFTLPPGNRKTVRARVLRSDSGLAEIRASADGWFQLGWTVNTGFRGEIHASLDPTLEMGEIRTFHLTFVDRAGSVLSLDSPVSVAVEITSAVIRRLEGPWSQTLLVDLPLGASSTPLIEIKPEAWFSRDGKLLVEVRINREYPIYSKAFTFGVLPYWWMSLVMAVFGGVLYGVYEILSRTRSTKRSSPRYFSWLTLRRIAVAGVAGSVAFLLAEWQVLGIAAQASSLRTFCVLGFLFAYAGMDVVTGIIARGLRPSK